MATPTGQKIAIVTGSAMGLGYEFASQLIAKGWLVVGSTTAGDATRG